MSTTPPAAAWYPDPTGRFQQRYWDGAQWTDNVATNGQTYTDPVGGAPRSAADDTVPVGTDSASRVQQQVAKATGAAGGPAGGGSLLTEPILVVNQKAKLIELTNQYAVYDQAGNQLAGVQEVGQSTAKKALRLLSNVDQFLTHKLEIKDLNGTVLLQLTRPAKIMKSTLVVSGPQGHEIGKIVQLNMIGKIRFGLEAGGEQLGSINAENWRAWNFSIADASGAEIARITKTWEGFGKAIFTTADNYVVQIHRPLEDPLRSLVVAAAVTVDTALKQDDK
jgi:uncharacterized protein YxjI